MSRDYDYECTVCGIGLDDTSTGYCSEKCYYEVNEIYVSHSQRRITATEVKIRQLIFPKVSSEDLEEIGKIINEREEYVQNQFTEYQNEIESLNQRIEDLEAFNGRMI